MSVIRHSPSSRGYILKILLKLVVELAVLSVGPTLAPQEQG